MALSSALFTRKGPGTDLLKRCAEIPAGHFFRGMPVNDAQKDAVMRIQSALSQLGFQVSDPAGVYGASTAEKVLAYKGPPRNILGPGQLKPDNIVGVQTIHRLDADVQFKPAPAPEFGSTQWRFSFFGNKGFTGKGIYSLFLGSTQLQDSANFDIVENFSGGSLKAGFKGETTGTFTTARKALVSEFNAAACNLSLVKLPLQAFLQGQLQIGTVGPVARQLNVVLPMPSLKDQTLGTTLTTGDFKMQGQTRKR
ncbi:MAG: peptidoglycan-binding domain-containing protein [Opitutaceae bacterium]